MHPLWLNVNFAAKRQVWEKPALTSMEECGPDVRRRPSANGNPTYGGLKSKWELQPRQ